MQGMYSPKARTVGGSGLGKQASTDDLEVDLEPGKFRGPQNYPGWFLPARASFGAGVDLANPRTRLLSGGRGFPGSAGPTRTHKRVNHRVMGLPDSEVVYT